MAQLFQDPMSAAEAFVESTLNLGMRAVFDQLGASNILVFEEDHIESFKAQFPACKARLLRPSDLVAGEDQHKGQILAFVIRARKKWLRLARLQNPDAQIVDMVVEGAINRVMGLPGVVLETPSTDGKASVSPRPDMPKFALLVGAAGGEVGFFGRKITDTGLAEAHQLFVRYHLAIHHAGGTVPIADTLRVFLRHFNGQKPVALILTYNILIAAFDSGVISPTRFETLIKTFKIPVIQYVMRDKVTQAVLDYAESGFTLENEWKLALGRRVVWPVKKILPSRLLDILRVIVEKDERVRPVLKNSGHLVTIVHEDFVVSPDTVLQRVEDLLHIKRDFTPALDWEAETEEVRPSFRATTNQAIRHVVDALGLYVNAQGSMVTLQSLIYDINAEQLEDQANTSDNPQS